MSAVSATPPGGAVAARPAALLILIRDGDVGLEVFMLERTGKAEFVPGSYVFPGGGLDAADGDAAFAAVDFDDARASRQLGCARDGLAFWVGAVRECFEEAGLLLATDASDRLVDFEKAGRPEYYADLRRELNAGRLSFTDLCMRERLRPAFSRMVYFAHWITPVGTRRRYDTRFFLAEAPAGQVGSHDEAETVNSLWIRPADALERHAAGTFSLVFATRHTLQALAGFSCVADALAHARAVDGIEARMPRYASGRAGRRPVGPDEAAYAEIARLDPHGHGEAGYEIVPGVPVRLGERLWRLTAANPGYMTGPGTNTYLLGDADGVTVLDPGPADETHVAALLAHAPGPITQVVVTHTHADHSPAAAMLKARTGARLFGLPAPTAQQDQSFLPDHQPHDGECISTRAGLLRVILTPGHTSNHLCYLLADERMLFTGDHVMQGSTVVISPPDGNMRAYLASLERLLAEDVDFLAPAHGFLMGRPRDVLTSLISHRLRREALILRALRADGPATAEALLPRVYSHVPAPLKRVAARSLLAHLLKLADDGMIREHEGAWRVG